MDFKNLTKESLPKEFQERIERFNRLFIEAGDGRMTSSQPPSLVVCKLVSRRTAGSPLL